MKKSVSDNNTSTGNPILTSQGVLQEFDIRNQILDEDHCGENYSDDESDEYYDDEDDYLLGTSPSNPFN